MQAVHVSASGRPRNADRQSRDTALVVTAAGLFIRHGYTKVSLKLISSEAKVAARTIYVRYGGKLGLFEAVVAAERDRMLSSLADLTAINTPFEPFLHQFCQGYLDLLNSEKAMETLRMVVAESAQAPQLAQTFYDAGPGAMRRHLAEVFSRESVRPLFRPELSPEMLGNLLLACLLEDPVARLLRTRPYPSDGQQVSNAIASFFALTRYCT